jgi:hypothetical protein
MNPVFRNQFRIGMALPARFREVQRMHGRRCVIDRHEKMYVSMAVFAIGSISAVRLTSDTVTAGFVLLDDVNVTFGAVHPGQRLLMGQFVDTGMTIRTGKETVNRLRVSLLIHIQREHLAAGTLLCQVLVRMAQEAILVGELLPLERSRLRKREGKRQTNEEVPDDACQTARSLTTVFVSKSGDTLTGPRCVAHLLKRSTAEGLVPDQSDRRPARTMFHPAGEPSGGSQPLRTS